MYLIGSRALELHGVKRKTADWDFVGTKQELECLSGKKISDDVPGFCLDLNGDKIEFKIDKHYGESSFYLPELCDMEIEYNGIKTGVINLKAAYLTKRSHAMFGVHWQKTMRDIFIIKNELKKDNFDVLSDIFTETEKMYYSLKRMEAEKKHRKDVNLEMNNDDFFKKSKNARKYIHDDLHEAVKYYDRPMYEICKKDINKAKLDYDLFLGLSDENKQKLAREETMVIALERVLIPQYELQMEKAYSIALQMLITRMTKGWFCEFMIDNYDKINKPDKDFIADFLEALENGKIREQGNVHPINKM